MLIGVKENGITNMIWNDPDSRDMSNSYSNKITKSTHLIELNDNNTSV
ncbi:MAG: hypothetical protein MRJ93_07335 [Nitrososphaeraceae archaeon]|nr:hypothetical protein [Nitrososphaeraceae archaeon]